MVPTCGGVGPPVLPSAVPSSDDAAVVPVDESPVPVPPLLLPLPPLPLLLPSLAVCPTCGALLKHPASNPKTNHARDIMR